MVVVDVVLAVIVVVVLVLVIDFVLVLDILLVLVVLLVVLVLLLLLVDLLLVAAIVIVVVVVGLCWLAGLLLVTCCCGSRCGVSRFSRACREIARSQFPDRPRKKQGRDSQTRPEESFACDGILGEDGCSVIVAPESFLSCDAYCQASWHVPNLQRRWLRLDWCFCGSGGCRVLLGMRARLAV